jgi:hypothetical protein
MVLPQHWTNSNVYYMHSTYNDIKDGLICWFCNERLFCLHKSATNSHEFLSSHLMTINLVASLQLEFCIYPPVLKQHHINTNCKLLFYFDHWFPIRLRTPLSMQYIVGANRNETSFHVQRDKKGWLLTKSKMQLRSFVVMILIDTTAKRRSLRWWCLIVDAFSKQHCHSLYYFDTLL